VSAWKKARIRINRSGCWTLTHSNKGVIDKRVNALREMWKFIPFWKGVNSYHDPWIVSRYFWQQGCKPYHRVLLIIRSKFQTRNEYLTYLNVSISRAIFNNLVWMSTARGVPHLLKYSTRFSIQPTKQAAQHARQASTAIGLNCQTTHCERCTHDYRPGLQNFE